MTEPVFIVDEADERLEPRSLQNSMETPKKRKKSEHSAFVRSAPFSEQQHPRKSKSSREMHVIDTKESKKVPMSAPRKASKPRKPVTTIMGHQFLLYEDSSSHSVPTQPSVLQIHNGEHKDPEDDFESSPPHLAPIPMHGLAEVSDAYKSGSSAPELMRPILGSNPETTGTVSVDSDADLDLLTFQQLRTRRDRFLRTVSLSPAIPASVQEDLDIMQSQGDVISSDDEEDYDDEDVIVDGKQKRSIGREQVQHPYGDSVLAGRLGSSLETVGYLESGMRHTSAKVPEHVRKRSKESSELTESKSGEPKLVAQTLSSLRESDSFIREGVVSKKGGLGGWQRRYLALDARRLYIFKSKAPNKPPKHVILLSFAQCKQVPDGNKQSRLFIFDIFTPEKKFTLATPTSAETDTWVSQIHQVCEGSMLDTLETSANLRRSMSTAAKHTRSFNKEIFEIRQLPGNNVCCDCSDTAPEWAVINLGIFVCIECSGIHRSLGVQISKVRSVTLDGWEQAHLNTMRNIGNLNANLIWEHSVPSYRTKPVPESTTEERRFWIHAKYVKRSFFDPSELSHYPLVPHTHSLPLQEDLEALKPASLELLQTDKAFRKHVRSLLLSDD